MSRADTAEHEWTAWGGLDGLPELTLPPPGRAVVLAAHPDDETLGAGGTIQRLAAAGWELRLVLATDGEAAYGTGDLGPTRVRELAEALERLGVAAEVSRVELPDRGVADHEDTLAAALPDCDLLLAPYREDGHRDHDACGRVAARHGAPLLEYPIWAWHWTVPGPGALPWHRAARLTLTGEERTRKQHAIDAHASQAGILPDGIRAHFRRGTEVLLG
jgi:LmbE family N-acetylglucosaminyl deacetylase